MALNDYMYFNGEVVKIFRLARGPDADMVYYTRNGTRRELLQYQRLRPWAGRSLLRRRAKAASARKSCRTACRYSR